MSDSHLQSPGKPTRELTYPRFCHRRLPPRSFHRDMPGWSRQRADSKLSAWAKSQDLATVERELERVEKDLRRAGSVSLSPDYIRKRQQERARAQDATSRLSSIGLRLDLGPFLFDHPPPPSSQPSNSITKSNEQEREILRLKDELEKSRAREADLEYALVISERKRDEERKSHDRERRWMISMIRKLKLELDQNWDLLMRFKDKYEAPTAAIESTQTPSFRKIYETDESFERTYRPSSSSRRVSSEESSRHRASLLPNLTPRSSSANHNLTRPSSSHPIDPIRNPVAHPHHPRPNTASILKNPRDGPLPSDRHRRTSFS